MIPKIKLITDPNNVNYAKVFINGFEVPGLIGVNVNIRLDERPIVTLDIVGKVETETISKEVAVK